MSQSSTLFRQRMILMVFIVILLVYASLSHMNDAYVSLSTYSLDSLTALTTNNGLRKVIPPVPKRDDIGTLLENEGFKTGVELGVQRGKYAVKILKQWKSCEKYLLVDLWEVLENYDDEANWGGDKKHDDNYKRTLELTEPYKSKVQICRNFTTECAKIHSSEKFDFVYVDARHDYLGVLADLHAWWPLVRDGGIIAGHDFVTQNEGPQQTKQNWTINYDGTVDPTGRAVYGAVIDFFHDPTHPERYRQVLVTYKEKDWWTWLVRK
jgi:hypothetical protein